jgi:hypothetical protein
MSLRDVVFFAGLILTAAGLGMVYLPLALIAPGMVLMWLGLGASRGREGE